MIPSPSSLPLCSPLFNSLLLSLSRSATLSLSLAHSLFLTVARLSLSSALSFLFLSLRLISSSLSPTLYFSLLPLSLPFCFPYSLLSLPASPFSCCAKTRKRKSSAQTGQNLRQMLWFSRLMLALCNVRSLISRLMLNLERT